MCPAISTSNPLASEISMALAQLSVGSQELPEWSEQGNEEWPSWFAVTDLAAASIGAAAAEVAGHTQQTTAGTKPAVAVDRRLASLWFDWSIKPQGWSLPNPWDAVAGDYSCREGFIKLHTNAPHHRSAALAALGMDDHPALTREEVAKLVARWDKDELEQAVIGAGGCAATLRSVERWNTHPQGMALQQEPLIAWQHVGQANPANPHNLRLKPDSPLSGVKVLDLTRVLAGPVASRFLARFGAEVLRIDPPDWEEPGVIPEVTLGKRCAGLDLNRSADRERFNRLLAGADILLHGYRPGALEGLGYGQSERLGINPSLIDVSLCAYGWTGPWAGRRGFDSLVQMSSGIAHWGMQNASSDKPSPLPVQALDHATGYLVAASAIRALRARNQEQKIYSARLSLARTALLLSTTRTNQRIRPNRTELLHANPADNSEWLESTPWGNAQRLKFPIQIDGLASRWPSPAVQLRSSDAAWRT